MKWFLGTMLASLIVMSLGDRARTADDKDAQAILDKAIKALGGEEKLSKVKAATWKEKNKTTSNDIEMTTTVTVQGLDHLRSEYELELHGKKVKGVNVFAENKGWFLSGDNKGKSDANALAVQKRSVYHLVVPMTVVPLKNKAVPEK
jgi:hypothetical protein